MPLRDFPSSDPKQNQDITKLLTVDELRELSNLTELTRSTIATLRYFEERKGAIFKAVRARVPKGGPVNEAD